MQSPRRRQSPRKNPQSIEGQENRQTTSEGKQDTQRQTKSRATTKVKSSGGPSQPPEPSFPPPIQGTSRGIATPSESSATILSAIRLRSQSRSPVKSSSDGNRRARAVKRSHLSHLTPAVTFKLPEEISDTSSLPTPVQEILRDCIIPIAKNRRPYIPSTYKDRINRSLDTPMKSKVIADNLFASELPYFAPEDITLVWDTVQDILAMARKYSKRDCTEAHWISVVVSPMLHLVRRLQRYSRPKTSLEVLDLSTVKVSPSELIAFDSEEYYCDLDKKIDFALGLDLSAEERDTLQQASFQMPQAARSINQTDSFARFTPLFLNGEVKLPYQNTDPLVQLGAWVAAEYAKRDCEGYSFEAPSLAVEVEGDVWNVYVAYARPDPRSTSRKAYQIEFLGPFSAGTTRDVEGCFKVLACLCGCAEWAVTTYRGWVEREVLAKHT